MREELSEMKEMNGDYVVSVAHQARCLTFLEAIYLLT